MPFVKFTPHEFEKQCRHPNHNPPSMIVLQPGVHTYQCPACKQEQTLTIHKPMMKVEFEEMWKECLKKDQDKWNPGYNQAIDKLIARK